ncbi:hypothetical protein EON65_15530 [archaeon]|nr:MAG: hypothetical protein EON65_15530 [archaeon]
MLLSNLRYCTLPLIALLVSKTRTPTKTRRESAAFVEFPYSRLPLKKIAMSSWEHSIGQDKVVLLVADCPPGLEFGIDCITHETGPNFKGLSCIPKGLHFVYYSYGGFQREGFFHTFYHDRVYCLTWDKREERFVVSADGHHVVSIHLPQDQQQQLEEEILNGKLNSFLAPYPDKQYQQWLSLSCHIDEALLSYANCPLGSLVLSDGEELVKDIRIHIPNISNSSTAYDMSIGNLPVFSPVKRLLAAGLQRASGVAGGQVTSMAMDKSWLLSDILQHIDAQQQRIHTHVYFAHADSNSILGEVQLSFLMFLFLHSYGALSQYKLLLSVVCESSSYLTAHTPFTTMLLKLLYHQLHFLPDDFFVDELSRENFLESSLKALCSSLNTHHTPPHTPSPSSSGDMLQETLYRFQMYVYKRFDIHIHNSDLEGGTEVMGVDAGVGDSDSHGGNKVDKGDGGGVACRWANIHAQLDEVDVHQISSSVQKTHIQASDGDGGHATGVGDGDSKVEDMDTDPPTPTPTPYQPTYITLSNNLCERQKYLYDWRYPLLCAEMCQQQGREDMMMTAMRVLEGYFAQVGSEGGGGLESGDGSAVGGTSMSVSEDEQKLVNEAMYFVEHESAITMT